MTTNLIRLVLLPAALLVCATTLQAADVTVSAPDSPMLRLALGKLESALQQQGDVLKRAAQPAPVPARGIAVTVDPAVWASTGPDGFRRARAGRGLTISAADERGAMYGVLDLAQELRSGTPLDQVPDRTARAQLELAKAPLTFTNPTR